MSLNKLKKKNLSGIYYFHLFLLDLLHILISIHHLLALNDLDPQL